MHEAAVHTDNGKDFVVALNHKERGTFTTTAITEGFRVGTGRTTFGVGPDASFISHDWILRSRSAGSLTLHDGSTRSLDGVSTVVHAIQQGRPYALASRWMFGVAHSEDYSVNLISFQATEKWGSQWVGQAGISSATAMIGATTDVAITPDAEVIDHASGYSIPAGQRYFCKGTDKDGKAWSVEFHSPMNRQAETIDLLAQLPWMLRKVIQTFVTRPFLYQWWEPADATITLDGVVKKGKVTFLQEASFMR
jgi:hypothetical protein